MLVKPTCILKQEENTEARDCEGRVKQLPKSDRWMGVKMVVRSAKAFADIFHGYLGLGNISSMKGKFEKIILLIFIKSFPKCGNCKCQWRSYLHNLKLHRSKKKHLKIKNWPQEANLRLDFFQTYTKTILQLFQSLHKFEL